MSLPTQEEEHFSEHGSNPLVVLGDGDLVSFGIEFSDNFLLFEMLYQGFAATFRYSFLLDLATQISVSTNWEVKFLTKWH